MVLTSELCKKNNLVLMLTGGGLSVQRWRWSGLDGRLDWISSNPGQGLMSVLCMSKCSETSSGGNTVQGPASGVRGVSEGRTQEPE